MKDKKLITIKEFASEYSLGINKAYEMAHSKDFPIIKLGRKILIVSNRVEEWINNNIGNSF
jgi:excisionase family DNA binding protein